MKICSIDNCESKTINSTISKCRMHYRAELLSNDSREECSVNDCGNPVETKQLCPAHYNQMRHGYEFTKVKPWNYKDLSWEDKASWRLEKYSEISDNGCIVWLGATDHKYPYGNIVFENKSWKVHRLAYCIKYGENALDGGNVVHHKCANKTCLNPDHLQLVDHKDNVAEMWGRREYEEKIRNLEKQIQELTLELEGK